MPAELSAGPESNTEPGQLLRAREAASLLAISERKLWELYNAKEIPCIRIGRMVRFSLTDLEHWISEHREGRYQDGF